MVEQILEMIARKMDGIPFTVFLITALAWILSPTATFFYVKMLERRRRKESKPSMGFWTRFSLTGTICFLLSFFIMHRVGRWDLEEARDQAILISIAFPVIVWACRSWLEKNQPQAAEDFGNDAFDPTLIKPTSCEQANDPTDRPPT